MNKTERLKKLYHLSNNIRKEQMHQEFGISEKEFATRFYDSSFNIKDNNLSNKIYLIRHTKHIIKTKFPFLYRQLKKIKGLLKRKHSKIYIDVTSLLNNQLITGIQRVVLEISCRLMKQQAVVLLKYDPTKNNFFILNNRLFLRNFFNNIDSNPITNKTLNLSDIKPRDFWIDLDAAWDCSTVYRPALYRELKDKKIVIFTLIHDILPIIHPEFFHQNSEVDESFLSYFSAALLYSDVILTTTLSTKKIIQKWARQVNNKVKIEVVPLGCNLKKTYNENNISNNVKKSVSKDALLMVGTIEPRKNHSIVLSVANRIFKETDLNIVIAGRLGWLCEATLKKINKFKKNNRFHFILNPNDDEIIYLYEHSFALIFPSFDEGFGLPVVESLYYKCPVFSSNIDVFKEISNNMVITFNNKSPDDLYNKIVDLYSNPTSYKNLKQSISNYKLKSWDDTMDALLKILLQFENRS